MLNLPLSKLPGESVKWGRSVEDELEKREDETNKVNDRVANLVSTVESQATHLLLLQNYIRTLCDLGGYLYPPAAAVPDVVPEPEPTPTPDQPDVPVVVRTLTVDAVWSCSWGSGGYKYPTPGGTDTDSRSLYQAGSGAKFSMFRFDIGAARGKKITKVELYMSNISTYFNGKFTALLGTHGNSSEPSSRPAPQNRFNVGWKAGEAKWILIDDDYYSGLSNGDFQGFTLGDGTSARQNYARFNGVGRNGAPKLRVTYED